MKVLLSIMSEKQWTPFYLNLDPCEGAIWPVWIGHIVDQNTKPTWIPVGVLSKMAYTRRLHLKGVSFSGFKYIEGLGFHLLKYMKG